MNQRPYQICTYCIMDISDPSIAFDEHGVCSHCNNFKDKIIPSWNFLKGNSIVITAPLNTV